MSGKRGSGNQYSGFVPGKQDDKYEPSQLAEIIKNYQDAITKKRAIIRKYENQLNQFKNNPTILRGVKDNLKKEKTGLVQDIKELEYYQSKV